MSAVGKIDAMMAKVRGSGIWIPRSLGQIYGLKISKAVVFDRWVVIKRTP